MNNEESKMNINWYPGHMAKAKREIIDDLKLIDVVIEILDARIPYSSQNPNIREIKKNKKKIILLNKWDLADEKETKKWQEYFKKQGTQTVLVNSNSGKGIEQVICKIEEVMKDKIEREKEKGRIGKVIRAIVIRNPKCSENLLLLIEFQRKIRCKLEIDQVSH